MRNALAIRGATGQAATATGLTALDSTTKCAYAAYLRIPPNSSTGDIMFHRQSGVGDGTIFRTDSAGVQVRTYNAGTNTQLTIPIAAGTARILTGRWFHVLVSINSVAALWYIDGKLIGKSVTAVNAWTVSGTRTTGIGTDNSASSNVDVFDLRHWAQNDADVVLASGAAIAQLCMARRPAGESIRLLAGGPNGQDSSGNGRHLTWSPSANILGAVTGPPLAPLRRRLRVSYAKAVAGNASPSANISAPTTGSTYAPGATVNFAGTGTDPEDGALTGTSLSWSSNLDGVLGTGTSLSTSSLSTGTHTITLTATDSLGATGTASITVNISASNVKGTRVLLLSAA